ncbi:BnaA03g11740D [Brassica napus]|uniref:BnaA03g11740D protein n=1 Tax=Brassica napus TaxID=3708 RepID=A0A078HYS3_BRANA|nr:BnaA03g11740D [Brassica napus]
MFAELKVRPDCHIRAS